jgi:hypothetical protein
MSADTPTMQHGILDSSRILVTLRASSVPSPLFDALFSLVVASMGALEKAGGGGSALGFRELIYTVEMKREKKLNEIVGYQAHKKRTEGSGRYCVLFLNGIIIDVVPCRSCSWV